MARAALMCKEIDRTSTENYVECPSCDPDNPKAVSRDCCVVCGGSGLAPVAYGVIQSEIAASKLELLKGGKKKSDEEYYDLDDVLLD